MSVLTSVSDELASLKAGIDSAEGNVREALNMAFEIVSMQVNHKWQGDPESTTFLIASQMLFQLNRAARSITGISAPVWRLAKLTVKIWAKRNGLKMSLNYI